MERNQLKKIMSLLSYDDYISSSRIAEEIQLSDKTVRKLIKELNEILKNSGLSVESKQGKGYILEIIDEKLYENGFNLAEINDLDRNINREIMMELLIKDDYISTDMIAEKLFVSKQTVFLKINKLESKLNQFGLKIERRPGFGMKIKGSEINKRHCLVNMGLLEEEIDLEKIEKCLKLCVMNDHYHISDYAYQSLKEHVYIMIQRIKNNIILQDEEIDKRINIEDFVLAMGRQLSLLLEIQFNIKIPNNEVLYLSIQLSGKRYLPEEHNNIIDEEVMNLANKIISTIKVGFNLDLSSDFDLLISLCNHLMMLKRRLELNVANKNPLLEEIMKNFPLAYSMAQQASIDIYHQYDKVISKDEIGYIALILALALEKKKFDINKKSILLVCAMGKSSAQLLKFKYMSIFKEYIKLIHVISLQELGTFDVKNYDYIISTIEIIDPQPIPIIKVNYFLSDVEIHGLKKKLAKRDLSNIIRFFPKELFYNELNESDKKAVIKSLCKRAEKYLKQEGLYESVWARESLANTAYGNLVALPHTDRVVTEHLLVSVAVLDHAIDWGGEDVQVIFLILIGNQEAYELRHFYEVLSSFIFDKSSVKSLIKSKNHAELIHLLRNKISKDIGD